MKNKIAPSIRILIAAALFALPACEIVHKPGVGTYAALGVDYKQRSLNLEAGTMDTEAANMSKSVEHVNRTINTLGTAAILAAVTKAKDAASAATDQSKIKADTDQARISADLQKSKDANALKLKEMEMEAPAAVAPTP